MNGSIGAFRAKVGQAVVQNAKQQSTEFVKSASDQIRGEETTGTSGDLYSQITGATSGEVNVGEIKENEAALMGRLKAQLEEEMQKARQERRMAESKWSEGQSQDMAEPVDADQPLPVSPGKPKRGGAGARISQVTNKSEVGRGAKN